MKFLHHGWGWEFGVGIELTDREVWLRLLPPRLWYIGKDDIPFDFAVDAYGFGFFELQVGWPGGKS